MLTSKIDLLVKKLENPCLDHLKMVDARVMCEESGKQATWASTARWSPRTSTSLVMPIMVFVVIKSSMLGGTNPVSRTSTEVNLLKDIVQDQLSINSGVDRKLLANDRILEASTLR
jgi:hypothetical protein